MSQVVESLRPKFRAQSRQGLLLLGLSLLTAGLGLAMVASASAIDSFKQTDSAATMFLRQGAFAIVGLVVLVIASNLPMALWGFRSRPSSLAQTSMETETGLILASCLFNPRSF